MKAKPAPRPVNWLGAKAVAERYGVTSATVRNWILVGVMAPGSQARVMLRAVKIGGRYRTRKGWLRQFWRETSVSEESEPIKAETESKRQKRFRKEKEEVEKRLGG